MAVSFLLLDTASEKQEDLFDDSIIIRTTYHVVCKKVPFVDKGMRQGIPF